MQEKELLTGKELLRHICLNGTPAEKRALFEFGEDSVEKVLAKFQLFSRTCFSRYYQHKSAPFHKTMAESYLRSYILGEKRMELGFRGCGKTALLELVIVFVLLNDTKHRRRYIKILSRDLKNSVKLVTGVYNKLIELEYIYGDVFANEGKKKQEERQDAFLMQKGVQVSAGTVGMAQRGHKQDAYRPDWIVLEDIEDRTSVSSQAITTTVIENIGEALDGIAIGGAFVVNGNYISEDGVIEWLKRMSAVKTNITPIMHPGGEPTWSAITREHVAELKSTSLDFVGEYLCDPQRSGNKYFNPDRIAEDLKRCKPPLRTSAGVKYWSSYIAHNSYGIGADTSEGKGLDSNAMALWDFTTGTLVGTFYDSSIRPDSFAHELVRVGREFGNCILAPEINNTSGGMVIQVIKDAEYPNIHRKTLTDRMKNVLTTQLGWHTNSKTKPQMLAEFARDYENGLIHIYDELILKEMRAFNVNDLDDQPATALATRHFDGLMAVCIGWAMRRYAVPAESDEDDELWGDYSFAQV
jgi:hypothetical protein